MYLNRRHKIVFVENEFISCQAPFVFVSYCIVFNTVRRLQAIENFLGHILPKQDFPRSGTKSVLSWSPT